MAKKRKKKKAPAAASSSPAKLVQRARSAVDHGDYHQAQNLYKKLEKKNPELYLPQLIEVQEKLLTQLCSQKKWSEVKQVLPGLQKRDPHNATLRTCRVQMALSQGDFDRTTQLAGQIITEAEKRDPQGIQWAADALVVAFSPQANYAALPADISKDLHQIHRALENISQNALDDALADIKPIGLKSLFSHWKLYIKGVCAYYSHEDQKALAAFDKLPLDSVAEKASRPLRMLLKGRAALPRNVSSAKIQEGICLLMGATEVAEALSRAEYLWHTGRYRDSFKYLKSNLAEFPTRDPGLFHCLSSFYYGAAGLIPDAKAENYLEFLIATAAKKRNTDAYEKFKALQAMALYLEKEVDWDEDIVTIWEEALDSYPGDNEEANLAKAMVYVHLGEIFCLEEPDDSLFDLFGFNRRRKKKHLLRNAQLAQECYEKALAADPESRKAHLALLTLYEKTGDKSKINQTLDQIIKKFPDEKEVLHKAGLRCMERDALIKGMKYLQQALTLDPIDRHLRASFIVICIKAAHAYARKGNFEKFTDALEKAESKGSRTTDDFIIGLPYLYVRWAAMLYLFKDKSDIADQMLQKAISTCHDPLKLHYFARLIGQSYGITPQLMQESRKIVAKAIAAPTDPTTGVALVQVLSIFKLMFKKKPPRWLSSEIKTVNGYLIKAAKPECSDQEAQAIVAYAMGDTPRNVELAAVYIDLVLNRNPDNARFRWFRFLCGFSMDIHPARLMRKADELKEILRLAKHQGDQEIAQAIEKTLMTIEESVNAFEEFKKCFGRWDEDDLFDDDDNFLEDDDFFDDDDDFFYDDDDDEESFLIDSDELFEEMEVSETLSPQEQLNLFECLDRKPTKK